MLRSASPAFPTPLVKTLIPEDFTIGSAGSVGLVVPDNNKNLTFVPSLPIANRSCLARPPTRPRSPRAAAAKRLGIGDTEPHPLVRSWLVDSGCPLDLIDATDCAGCRDFIVDGPIVTLATANGDTVSSQALPLRVGRVDEVIRPHVLEETPNVLSLGRRVVEDGYSFWWEGHSMSPKLVHPTTGEDRLERQGLRAVLGRPPRRCCSSFVSSGDAGIGYIEYWCDYEQFERCRWQQRYTGG